LITFKQVVLRHYSDLITVTFSGQLFYYALSDCLLGLNESGKLLILCDSFFLFSESAFWHCSVARQCCLQTFVYRLKVAAMNCRMTW